jgi:hypothetical protein
LAKVLIFRPKFDLATSYGWAWLEQISRIAAGFGHSVLDLAGAEATKEALYDALQNFKPDLVIACSHGSPTQFTAQNEEIALTKCYNDQVMSGKQAYFVSCLVGQELLPSMVEKDAVTVGGYTSEFVWVVHSDYSDKPLEDPYAYPFMRAVIEPCRRLLGGASWREWYDYSIALFNKGVSEWFESTDPNAAQIVAGLEHDRDSLVVFGEKTIRAVPRRLAVAGVPFLSVVPALLGFVVVEASLEKGF